MTNPIRFDNKVAIVTGAGRGLGRDYAIQLAQRGAKVVVADLGAAMDGQLDKPHVDNTEVVKNTVVNKSVAQQVVDEITAFGGEAIACGGSVASDSDAQAIVRSAVDTWGTVDILINNAGILRDKTFLKKDLADFRAVMDVHLWGSIYMTHAVWPIMYAKQYGRIVMTTSGSGILGNFGQTDYAAAKMGVVGLMNSLAIEGARKNVYVNAIKPAAATRMAAGIVSDEIMQKLRPELITPAVLYLCAEQAPNGSIIQATGGHFSRVILAQNPGVDFSGDVSVDDVAAKWENIHAIKNLHRVKDQETA
jgi:NAD(P)-dependent dehydrogenase (short-subunit alcohol dehydrogenase family)